MAAVLEALSQLTAVNLKELHHLRSDHTRGWDQLVQLCSQASGISNHKAPRARPDAAGIAAFFPVFDFVVAESLGCWILDVVAEVCGDTRLTSNDPLEAQLLDGTFVHAWCQHALAEMEHNLHEGLQGEAALLKYASERLAADASKADVVVRALRALARIRGGAGAGGSNGGVDGRPASDGGVAQGLGRALCLQRSQTLVQWSHEQAALVGGSAGAAALGPYKSLNDWAARVKARRDMRPAGLQGPTFLESTLQALGLQRAYPFPNFTLALAHIVKAASGAYANPNASPNASPRAAAALAECWCVASGDPPADAGGLGAADAGAAGPQLVDSWRWYCCLALTAYLLTDLGRLGQPEDAAHRRLQGSFSSWLHVSPGQVAAWSAAALLDDAPVAAPWSALDRLAGSPLVHRACTLLLQHAPSRLHISLMQVLSTLGRADTALLLHRAQQQQGGAAAPEAAAGDAKSAGGTWAVMELRLRCGLVAEALAVARQAAAQQRTAAARRRTLSALLTRLLDWCTSSTSAAPVGAGATAAQRPRQGAGEGEGGGGGGAAATAALREWSVQLVLELLCGDEEEAVLVAWLRGAAAAGRPVGGLLPVLLAARGKVPEALGAYQQWAAAPHSAAAGAATPGLPEELDAVVNCAAAGLPAPLRNVHVDGGADTAALSSAAGPAAATAQLLSNLTMNLDAGVPLLLAGSAAGGAASDAALLPPALVSSTLPSPPPALLQPPAPPAPGGNDAAAAAFGRGGAAAPAGLSGLPAGGSTALVSRVAALGEISAAGPLFGGGEGGLEAGGMLMPPPPPLASSSGFVLRGGAGSGGGEGGGGGAATRPLFALTAGGAWGGVAAAAAGLGGEAAEGNPTWKRARPNTWAT